MKIIGESLLDEFAARHTIAKKPLAVWRDVVARAAWRTPQEIKNTFRSADFRPGNRVIFNIKGNHFRLVVRVRFQAGAVLIEWVGTHAEYDRKTF